MAEQPNQTPTGGLTLLVQHDSPGTDKETHWLPAPAEGFFMMTRMYQLQERMYRGEYTIPSVDRRN